MEHERFEQRLQQSRILVEHSTKTEMALQLISIIDVIELAKNSIKPQTDREISIQKGYSMLENKMLGSLREMGVRIIETKGSKFNPRFHEVLVEEGTNEYPPTTIINEFKKGYILADRVLRLAQVKVSVASSFL